jgi:rhamnogalacturonan acetylesterase
MLYSQAIALLALATTAVSAPSGELTKRAQTVYLAGDSTMARASGVITGNYLHFNLKLRPLIKYRMGCLLPVFSVPQRGQ